jgi:glycosyltransferase involved in cell wall biosynthesis
MRIVQVSVGSVRMPPEEGWAPMQVLVNTSKCLAALGQEVVILDRKYSKRDPDVESLDGIRIVRLNAPQIRPSRVPRFVNFLLAELDAVTFTLKVSAYLRSNASSIDIVHLHYTSIGLILAYLNRGLRRKMVYTCHLGQWSSPPKRLRFLDRLHLFLDAFLMRRIAGVVALNESMKERIVARGRVDTSRVGVLPNGVDTSFFSPDLSVEGVRQRFGLGGRLTVLFVGRLTRMKGVDVILKAADILVNEWNYRQALFLLVGPAAFDATEQSLSVAEIRRFMDSHGLAEHIFVAGSLPLDELRRLYAASDVLLLPSQFEGDPLVTLEAMACGTPVIASRVGGLPKQVRDGSNGYLVDSGDERQVANAIRQMADNPHERLEMGRRAREYAVKEADWHTVAERLLKVYEGMGKTGQA